MHNNDISTVFCKAKLNQNISFEEFEKIGWTRNQFMYYLQLIDEYRSALILTRFRLDGYKPVDKSVLTETVERMVKYINSFTQKSIMSCCELFYFVKPNNNIGVAHLEESDNPDIVFYDFHSIRNFVERMFFLVFEKNQLNIKISFQPEDSVTPDKYYDFSIEELQDELNYLEDLQRTSTNHFWSDIPDKANLDDYNDIQRWLKEIDDYYEEEALCEEAEHFDFDNEYPITERIKIIKHLLNNEYPHETIYIHRGNIRCIKQKHDIESVTATVPTMNNKQATINVSHCKHCNQYFIHECEYNHYRELYDVMLVRLFFTESGKFNDISNYMASHSPLYLCGYNVSQESNFSSDYRKEILKK